MRHRASPFHSRQKSTTLDLLDHYAGIYDLSPVGQPTRTAWHTLALLYTPFQFKALYLSTGLACFLLLLQVLVYTACHRRLLMPRSLFHTLVNKWLSLLLLISVYVAGVQQTRLANLCLFSSMLIHFSLLASFMWYMLLFYCFFAKLNRIKKRNFELIFRRELSSGDEEVTHTAEYIQKPVVYLYMLGYGVPLLVCGIVISITKRGYIHTPYLCCFTNDLSILVISIFVPVAVLFTGMFLLIALILVALRRIVLDLKLENFKLAADEQQEEEKKEDNNEKSLEKQNWVMNSI